MEGVEWYAYQDGGRHYIVAEFDNRTRRVNITLATVALVRHAIEQMTFSIKEARAAAAARAAYAELH